MKKETWTFMEFMTYFICMGTCLEFEELECILEITQVHNLNAWVTPTPYSCNVKLSLNLLGKMCALLKCFRARYSRETVRTYKFNAKFANRHPPTTFSKNFFCFVSTFLKLYFYFYLSLYSEILNSARNS